MGCAVLGGICAILCTFLPESPRYYFGTERYDDCRKSLRYIAKFNGVKDFKDPHFDAEDFIFVEDVDEDVEHSPGAVAKALRNDDTFDHLLEHQKRD